MRGLPAICTFAMLGMLAGDAPARRSAVEPTPIVLVEPTATAGDVAAAVWVAYGQMGTRTTTAESDAGSVGEWRPEPRSAAPMLLPRPEVPRLRSPDGVDGGRYHFLAGYRVAGGNPNYEGHFVNDVIPCEYGWGEYVKVNQYESRAQFDPQSWQTAGGGDPADDYQVGANVARWIALIDDPGSTSGWPVCWWR